MRDDWKIVRFKDVLKSPLLYGINEAVEDDNPENPRFIRITDLNDNDTLKDETFKSIPLENARGYLLKDGDILLARSGATAGKTFLFNEKIGVACFAGYLIRARLNKKIAYYCFFSHITRSYYYENWKNRVTIQATIQNVSADKYNQFSFYLPPLPEQHAIANYLDKKLSVIDKHISLLEKKRDTYKRLRKNLINQTVRRGLNPDVELKDSGIEWLGKIPKHWEVKRVKELGKLSSSGIDKKIIEDEELIKIVNYVDVYNNQRHELYNSDNYMVVSASIEKTKSKQLKKGDILITPSSETVEDIGISSVVMEDLIETLFSYHILRIRFYQHIDLIFKKYLFNNIFVQNYFSSKSMGTTRKILNLSKINNLQVPIPPLSEQQAIADYLDTQTLKIDNILENINRQLGKLAQLKKSLINECVTGEREFQINL